MRTHRPQWFRSISRHPWRTRANPDPEFFLPSLGLRAVSLASRAAPQAGVPRRCGGAVARLVSRRARRESQKETRPLGPASRITQGRERSDSGRETRVAHRATPSGLASSALNAASRSRSSRTDYLEHSSSGAPRAISGGRRTNQYAEAVKSLNTNWEATAALPESVRTRLYPS